MKNCFSKYNLVYHHSEEFPPAAKDEIPAELLQAIDQGNAAFFRDIKQGLPKLYEVLTQECGPICLLEDIMEDDGTGFGPSGSFFEWGTECNDKLILIGIPTSMTPAKIARGKKNYLPCLPAELHGCFTRMDGMTLPDPIDMGDYDLPIRFNAWVDLENYCMADEIPQKAIKKIYRDFAGNELRIFFEGSKGDLVLLNFTRKDGILYHVKNLDFDNYRPIKNPVAETLDSYFANAVRGFPENVELS